MFTLDQVVPWGRSFDEYRRMFDLTDDELGLRLGVVLPFSLSLYQPAGRGIPSVGDPRDVPSGR
jgi:hypothetical protein